jgi:hypothetical protein
MSEQQQKRVAEIVRGANGTPLGVNLFLSPDDLGEVLFDNNSVDALENVRYWTDEFGSVHVEPNEYREDSHSAPIDHETITEDGGGR